MLNLVFIVLTSHTLEALKRAHIFNGSQFALKRI